MSENASFARHRQDVIRAKLQTEGRVFCLQLSQELEVSEHTIRRDLQDLAKDGVCRRVHGGAVSALPAAADFHARLDEKRSVKELLGEAGALLLRDGACVFMDAGTTNLAIAKALPPELAVTVVTNTPDIAAALLKHPAVEVIMLGGRLNPKTGGAHGITTLKQLQGMHFDQCVLGVCALDAGSGLTAFEYDDAEFKQAVIAQSEQVIVALTAEKTPGAARYQISACASMTDLVVPADMAAEKIAPFAELGIAIHRAGAA
ncbi:DeoR/GlpR family DNA-binding transcription regulator [Duganella sp.]|uniref:DeoR/GlpR family DNA-binding transcription regulator n=1 Tax=Duganella sp. TaxID=1904440 RepID=UPI0031D8ED6A